MKKLIALLILLIGVEGVCTAAELPRSRRLCGTISPTPITRSIKKNVTGHNDALTNLWKWGGEELLLKERERENEIRQKNSACLDIGYRFVRCFFVRSAAITGEFFEEKEPRLMLIDERNQSIPGLSGYKFREQCGCATEGDKVWFLARPLGLRGWRCFNHPLYSF